VIATYTFFTARATLAATLICLWKGPMLKQRNRNGTRSVVKPICFILVRVLINPVPLVLRSSCGIGGVTLVTVCLTLQPYHKIPKPSCWLGCWHCWATDLGLNGCDHALTSLIGVAGCGEIYFLYVHFYFILEFINWYNTIITRLARSWCQINHANIAGRYYEQTYTYTYKAKRGKW
jgi:hypothetical protein